MLDYRGGRVVDFYDIACAILKYYKWTEAYFLLTSSRHVSAKFKK